MLSGETRNIVCQKGSFAAAATSVKSMQVVAGPSQTKSLTGAERKKKKKILVFLVCYIQS
jgi:hypothetical protein